MLKLGVNIDHVATLRQARYPEGVTSPNIEPSVLAAALEAEAAGADSITAHLRADRRHIQDRDIVALREGIGTDLNFELGNTKEIVDLAIAARPAYACLVPEHREEVSTEGGLDVVGQRAELAPTIDRLQGAGIGVSLFVDPDIAQIEAAAESGAEMVELHTGSYANVLSETERAAEALRLADAARVGHAAGLQINAGHGITTANLPGLFGVPHMVELNIGHHLVARAISIGLGAAVVEMRAVMDGYSG